MVWPATLSALRGAVWPVSPPTSFVRRCSSVQRPALAKPPRPEKKQPLLGGAERRLNRNQRKPLKTAADPGELNERAATLQEKRGLSRYGERYKGKREGDGRYGKRARKEKKRGTRHGEHYEERKTKEDTGTGSTAGKGKQRGHDTGNTGKKRNKQKSEKDKRQRRESYVSMNIKNKGKESKRGKQERKET
ncbi:hypothetical protein NDU88_000807 [Pleurodeles waltl]|uniref:Uncharacterized protein n=1 Tax=Pleurodeles waltl TaxID=8319 RepID=A0AAV7Q2G5_PLEWA|nr:hypothetical protein NDU88_000807 [Pleurodeles waltl]